MSSSAAYIRLLRPKQWIKNIVVLLPMFFGGGLLSAESWKYGLLVFISFCFTASSIYCINDIADCEADRLHPSKRFRPVASGEIGRGKALIAGSMLVIAGMLVAVPAGGVAVSIVAGYWLMNIAYTLGAKRIALLDVFIIATGFVLRLACGGVAENILLSPWIICMIFLLTLFLGFGKRRDDVVLFAREGTLVRKNTSGYSLDFLNITLGILASVTIVCYIVWSLSPEAMQRLGSGYLYVTSVFVLAGILRYLQLTIVEERSGSPTHIVLSDLFIQLCICGWLISFILILYL